MLFYPHFSPLSHLQLPLGVASGLACVAIMTSLIHDRLQVCTWGFSILARECAVLDVAITVVSDYPIRICLSQLGKKHRDE